MLQSSSGFLKAVFPPDIKFSSQSEQAFEVHPSEAVSLACVPIVFYKVVSHRLPYYSKDEMMVTGIPFIHKLHLP